MLKRKKVREKGKVKFSRYFQNLKPGDRVSVIRDLSFKSGFPKSIQGKSGIIEEKKGNSWIVKMRIGREKEFIIHPVHLKKLKA